jgi:menaquinone-dependent protoporphyrinogen oxidase
MKGLVAYASMAGSTAEVAGIIGSGLTGKGHQVDVRKAAEVKNIDCYDFVIAGTGIRAGKTYKQFDQFVLRFGENLKTKPNALFVVCLTMKEDTAENQETVRNYILKQMATQPKSVGLFAGVMDFSKIGFLLAAIIRKIDKTGNPEGNFIDRGKIAAWVDSLSDSLK